MTSVQSAEHRLWRAVIEKSSSASSTSSANRPRSLELDTCRSIRAPTRRRLTDGTGRAGAVGRAFGGNEAKVDPAIWVDVGGVGFAQMALQGQSDVGSDCLDLLLAF